MSRRFGDIVRANELEDAFEAYKNWLDTRHLTSKRLTGGTVGDSRKREKVFIKPFNWEPDRASTAVAPVSMSVNSGTRLGQMDGRVLLSNPASNGITYPFRQGEQPSRVYLFESNGNREYKESKITKLFYLKYTGDSYSTPIGRKTNTELEPEGVLDAFAHLRSISANKDYVRVWHKPEDLIAKRA